MDVFKRGLLFVTVLTALLLSSCEKDTPSVSDKEESDAVVVEQITTTAFTASMTAKFNGVSKVDLALGKSGVLYCLKNENAESIFKSWKNGNDEPDCIVFQGGRIVGEEFNGTIKDLYPNTEYSYCFFLKNRDNSLREISEISTFHTTELIPEYKNMSVGAIRMFSATLTGTVTINSSDLDYCTWGLLLSEVENGKMDENARFVRFWYYEGAPEVLEFNANRLKPATDYWYRAYVSYTTSDKEEHFIYGPESKFTTIDTDGWGVDLGLPSGLLWSKGVLGRQDFDNGFEAIYSNPYYCCWGSLKNKKYEEPYEYLDLNNNGYINIGDHIASSQYDVAQVILGGKWRLPTKEDIDELNDYCTVSAPKRVEYHYSTYNSSSTLITNIAVITGKNGNSIKTAWYPVWTGDMSANGDNPYSACYHYDLEKDSAYIQLCDTLSRERSLLIRPVWDPNM